MIFDTYYVIYACNTRGRGHEVLAKLVEAAEAKDEMTVGPVIVDREHLNVLQVMRRA